MFLRYGSTKDVIFAVTFIGCCGALWRVYGAVKADLSIGKSLGSRHSNQVVIVVIHFSPVQEGVRGDGQ